MEYTKKYRPKTFEEMVLPNKVQKQIEKILAKDTVGNLLLYGDAGIGKTTLARIMLEKFNYDALTPKSTSVKDIKEVYQTTTVSLSLKGYAVFIDEAEVMSDKAQKDILQFLEGTKTAVQSTIIIANNIKKLTPPFKSRFYKISLDCDEEDQKEYHYKIKLMLIRILGKEKVNYTSDVLDSYIVGNDIRSIITNVQYGISDNVLEEYEE